MLNTLRFFALLTIAALTITACGQAPGAAGGSPIEVQDPWARAAVAMDMNMDTDADAMSEGAMDEDAGADAMAGMNHDAMNHGEGATSAVYMTLVNPTGQADALIGAATDAAEIVELHLSSMDNGIMRMRPVERIDVPANGQAELMPGGYHVMLIGLTRDLDAGDTIDLTLNFEQAGALELSVPVRRMER
jgi:periplasmic copper chaperone A